MNYLFLNQYGPPDPAPTSRLAGELADFLRSQGHTVVIISQPQDYHDRLPRGVRRLCREVSALVSIAAQASRRQKPDVVLAFSSPPCLLPIAALIALKFKTRLAHWAMDLYPELAEMLGEIRTKSVSAIIRRLMQWGYRKADLIVALDEDMAAHLQTTYGVRAKVLPPWPPDLTLRLPLEQKGSSAPPGAKIAMKGWTWLYSGNLGRSHEWRPLLATQLELERRRLPVQLLFEGGGAMWNDARQEAKSMGLRRCYWTGYVTEAESFETLQASCLVCATQREAARGLLWPSKLARIIPIDKPLLWIGPTTGAIAQSISGRPATGCFEPEAINEVVGWIQTLFNSPERSERLSPTEIDSVYRGLRGKGCSTWERWLMDLCKR